MSTTKAVKRGRPSQAGAYVEIIKSTPKGEAVLVGNLSNDEAFASHQAADYRRKTILAAAKSAKVSIVRVADALTVEGDDGTDETVPGYFLSLVGRAKTSA